MRILEDLKDELSDGKRTERNILRHYVPMAMAQDAKDGFNIGFIGE